MTRPRRTRRVLTDDQRRTLRWWLMLGLIPIAIVALVLATKLISVNVLSQTSIDRFESRAYAQGADAARGLETWNWTEPWKAPFAVGVNLTMAGTLDEGRAKLEEALALHGEPATPAQLHEHCVIVASLVTAVEKQGDAAREAADTQAANGFYGEALEVAPQVGHERGLAGGADRHGDVRVVVQHRAVRPLAEDATREGVPVGVGVVRQGDGVVLADVGDGVVPGRGVDGLARVGGDAGQADQRDLGADIVQNGGGDPVGRDGRQRHGDQTAHGGAQEGGPRDSGLVHQGQHVPRVLDRLVSHRVGGAVRPGAAPDVDRQHAAAGRGDQGGHGAEVGRVPRQSGNGDDRQLRFARRASVVAGVELQAVVGTPPAVGEMGHGRASFIR